MKAAIASGKPWLVNCEMPGRFRLSVYTMKGDTFLEVIVDYRVGTIAQVDVIKDSGDLAAAQSQKEIMARATRTLEAAITDVVRTNPGYRAVSAMPRLNEGGPLVEIILVNGTSWNTVFGSLD